MMNRESFLSSSVQCFVDKSNGSPKMYESRSDLKAVRAFFSKLNTKVFAPALAKRFADSTVGDILMQSAKTAFKRLEAL